MLKGNTAQSLPVELAYLRFYQDSEVKTTFLAFSTAAEGVIPRRKTRTIVFYSRTGGTLLKGSFKYQGAPTSANIYVVVQF